MQCFPTQDAENMRIKRILMHDPHFHRTLSTSSSGILPQHLSIFYMPRISSEVITKDPKVLLSGPRSVPNTQSGQRLPKMSTLVDNKSQVGNGAVNHQHVSIYFSGRRCDDCTMLYCASMFMYVSSHHCEQELFVTTFDSMKCFTATYELTMHMSLVFFWSLNKYTMLFLILRLVLSLVDLNEL